MKLLIQIGGGLGDLFRCYFTDENSYNRRTHGSGEWGRLEQICDYFDIRDITVIGETHNIEQCKQFLQYHPNVGYKDLKPWTLSGNDMLQQYLDKGYKQLRDALHLGNFTWEQPIVHFTPAEDIELRELEKKGKYVVLYPFLGIPENEPWPIHHYAQLITELKELEYNVAVLGGSYQRVWIDSETGIEQVRELKQDILELSQFDNVYNYIGVGARMSAQLTIDAEFYIGTFGAYAMVAHAHAKRSFILHEDNLDKHFQTGSSDCFFMSDSRTHRINVSRRNVQDITKQITHTIKGWE